jgi:hypothetical protein
LSAQIGKGREIIMGRGKGIDIFTMVIVQTVVFWIVTLCSLVRGYIDVSEENAVSIFRVYE